MKRAFFILISYSICFSISWAQNKVIRGKVINYSEEVSSAMVSFNTLEGLKTSAIDQNGEFRFTVAQSTPVEISDFSINPIRKFAIVGREYKEGAAIPVLLSLKALPPPEPEEFVEMLESLRVALETPSLPLPKLDTLRLNLESLKVEPKTVEEEDTTNTENTGQEDGVTGGGEENTLELINERNQTKIEAETSYNQTKKKIDTLSARVEKQLEETTEIQREINEIKTALNSNELTAAEKDELKKQLGTLSERLEKSLSLLQQLQIDIDRLRGKYNLFSDVILKVLLGIIVLLSLVALFYFIVARIRRKEKERVDQLNESLQKTEIDLQAKVEEIQQQSEEITSQRDQLGALLDETQKQKENLEELQRTKDLLISAVNHDLRNPLNPIKNFSDPTYPDQNKDLLLQRIHSKSKRMFNMIEDIMNVYRADRLKLSPETKSLHQVTEEAIREIKDMLYDEEIPQIQNQVDPHLMATFDRDSIERVIENFLTNAIKYTPPEGQITFRSEILTSTDNKPEAVKFLIEDTGQGIAQDKLETIFEPFVISDARNLGNAKAVGIGLTFCKTIIEAHESRLEIASQEGQGTTFSFTLPVAEVQPATALPTAEFTLDDLKLSEQDKAFLLPFAEQIQTYELHDFKISEVIGSINSTDTQIIIWKKLVDRAIEHYDEEAFHQLIQRVKS